MTATKEHKEGKLSIDPAHCLGIGCSDAEISLEMNCQLYKV